MIKKEDIKVGLEFYITRKNCLKCNFDPMFVHDDNIPVLFRIERNDDCTYLCTSADSNHEFFAHFDTESIMKFGVAIAAGGESRNEKRQSKYLTHPIMRGLRIYVVLSLWIFADTLTSIQGTLSSISCERIRWMATRPRPRNASRTCVRRCFISKTK